MIQIKLNSEGEVTISYFVIKLNRGNKFLGNDGTYVNRDNAKRFIKYDEARLELCVKNLNESCKILSADKI